MAKCFATTVCILLLAICQYSNCAASAAAHRLVKANTAHIGRGILSLRLRGAGKDRDGGEGPVMEDDEEDGMLSSSRNVFEPKEPTATL